MPTFNFGNVVNDKTLIDFSLFSIIDTSTARDEVFVKDLEASDNVMNYIIRTMGWSGYQKTVDGITKIGYKSTTVDDIEGNGVTEDSAYTAWIELFKDRERRFKKLLPIDTLSQSQYDGLLSLYWFTNDITSVGTEDRKFRIYEFIEEKKWDYVATALILGGSQRTQRQAESKIIILADYGQYKNRSLIKEQGIQQLVKEYSTFQLTDKQKAQAEYVYYAETSRFLPNLSESRKRSLINQLNQ
jgi:hypothetical protein